MYAINVRTRHINNIRTLHLLTRVRSQREVNVITFIKRDKTRLPYCFVFVKKYMCIYRKPPNVICSRFLFPFISFQVPRFAIQLPNQYGNIIRCITWIKILIIGIFISLEINTFRFFNNHYNLFFIQKSK